MTSTSGGGGSPDWNAIIKPFVACSFGSLKKEEVAALVKAVVESQKEIKESTATSSGLTVFYDVLTVLASHVLSVAAASELLPRQSFPSVCAAVKVLCESLLNRLPTILKGNHPVISVKVYANVIQEFCTGGLLLSPEEVSNMLTQLKNHELPVKAQSSPPVAWDKENVSVKEVRRTRVDPAALILEQVSIPVMSLPSNKPVKVLLLQEVAKVFQSLKAGQRFVEICVSRPGLKPYLLETFSVQQSTLSNTMKKIIHHKISGSEFSALADDMNLIYQLLQVQQFAPLTALDAQKLCQLGMAVMTAATATANHLYGSHSPPQGPSTMVSTTSSSSGLVGNEPELHTGTVIVAQALWTQQTIIRILQDDTALLQTTWLNCCAIFAKHAFLCIESYMHHLSHSDKLNLVQVQAHWNEIVTSIACHAVEMANNFMSLPCGEKKPDPKKQFKIEEQNSNEERIAHLFDHLRVIEILMQMSTLSYRKAAKLKMIKVKQIEEAKAKSEGGEAHDEGKTDEQDAETPKAGPAKSGSAEPKESEENEQVDVEIEDENHSVSDIMTTDDDDDGDDDQDYEDDEDGERPHEDNNEADVADDEPILGSWMEAVLAPTEIETNAEGKAEDSDQKNEDQEVNARDDDCKGLISEFMKERDNAMSYMESSLVVLSFMSKDVISHRSDLVRSFAKDGVNSEHMASLLALLLKDLDQEKSTTEIGAISTIFEDSLNRVYLEFSQEISRLAQNILALNFFSSTVQGRFLHHLGISLDTITNADNVKWPFGLGPRTLAVLVQVILLKQDREGDIVNILKGFLSALVSIATSTAVPHEYSDLPVEHAQTLLFLFHTLSLMQKKQIMLELSGSIVKVGSTLTGTTVSTSHQTMAVSRLLLFFDYLIRQLYEPGMNLVAQIQYNLFNEESAGGTGTDSTPTGTGGASSPQGKRLKQHKFPSETSGDLGGGNGGLMSASETLSEPPNSKPLPPSRIFCDCSVVDKTWESEETSTPLPKYYNLISTEPNYQENPRLDGLALNFLMNKTEQSQGAKAVEYTEVLDAILKIAETCFQLDGTASRSGEVFYLQHFINRIALSLPPPVAYLEKLKDPNVLFHSDFMESPARVFYFIIWVPRLQNKLYSSLVRDTLCKQGLIAGDADNLAKTCSTFSPRITMKMLNKAVDWIERTAVLSAQKVMCHSLYFAIEAVTSHAVTTMSDLSEEEELLIVLIRLLEEGLKGVQTCVIQDALSKMQNTGKVPTDQKKWEKSAVHLLSISSGFLMTNPVAKIVSKNVDNGLKSAMEACTHEDFDAFPTWVGSEFKSDALPFESWLLSVVDGHMASETGFISLKHVLGSAVRLVGAAVCTKNSQTPKIVKEQLIDLLTPLLLNKSVEFLGQMVGSSVDSSLAKADAPLNSKLVEKIAIDTLKCICYPELRAALKESSHDSFIEESLLALLSVLLNGMEKPEGKSESDSVFVTLLTSDSGNLLLSLLHLLMNTKEEKVLTKLCNFLSTILSFDINEKDAKKVVEILHKELGKIEDLPATIFAANNLQNEIVIEAACRFFSSLVSLLGKDTERKVIPTLLKKSLQVVKQNVASEKSESRQLSAFENVLQVIIQMANMCDAEEGHVKLFQQMTEWLHEFSDGMEAQLQAAIETSAQDKSEKTSSTEFPTLQAIMTIMDYILDLGKTLQTVVAQNPSLQGFGKNQSSQNPFVSQFHRILEREQTPGVSTPPNEVVEDAFDLCESEIGDEGGEDDESGGEDSDEEGLNSKLCTYTITQKEFMSQHWYHCHTCRMVDGVGVCSICARVCHKGHDVTYSKYGSFFCDCGAKTDGSCIALVKRPSDSANNKGGSVPSSSASFLNPFLSDVGGPSSGSSGSSGFAEATRRYSLEQDREGRGSQSYSSSTQRKEMVKIQGNVKWEELLQNFKNFSQRLPYATLIKLRSAVKKLAGMKTPVGAYLRVQKALQSVRKGGLEFLSSEDLMIPSLGSQENAFENIKMTYNGDQGSIIRALISSQVIKRTTIAALAAPGARRHYLAMSQEKGKLTILQMGALLSGAETGKKKLTLPRLATLTLPFTVLTMAANPLRDDVLAVCGLKECHVLVIGTGGSISSHIVLQPQLEGQNHIIKPMWIPGSQSELAILTSESVKVYDLGKDVISPTFYFLLPSGKVRDATFVVQGDGAYIIIMANDGRMYYEKMDELTSASNGPYYLTNDLNYSDAASFETSPDKKDSAGTSIHYSHPLKLLFYTYPNGFSYVAVLDDLAGPTPFTNSTVISTKASSPSKPSALGLSQWTEVFGHPGLIFAVSKEGTPFALMLSENKSEIQEVKVVWKSKPLDMVAMRHVAQNGKLKTSLVILGEDGSLKVFDSSDSTDFWLSPRLLPQTDSISLKSSGKKSASSASRKGSKHLRGANGQVIFPVDFFEHCQPMNDVEFGGNDLLQIYNVAQLKNRLNSSGLYIVCTKSSGFNLDVTNNDASLVITGFRLMLGSQDATKVPSFIQVFGRTIPVALTRARWYDIPLMREESLQADNKLVITFGASHDPQSITFVDSVKIYGKNKDAFGWPDDSEDGVSQCAATGAGIISTVQDKRSNEENTIEKIIISGIELCDLSVSLCPRDVENVEGILKAGTEIYLETYPAFTTPCRNLICSLLSSKNAYYEHRDKAVLTQCVKHLMDMNEKPVQDVDPELFHYIVTCFKNIAILRPQHISACELVNFEYQGPMSSCRVIETLCKVFEKLVEMKPKNLFVVPVDTPGIQRVESLALGLAEIIYAVVAADLSLVPKLAPCLIRLLLSRNCQICVPVRTVLVKRLRPKNVRKRKVTIPGPSPPHCATPDAGTEVDSPREPVGPAADDGNEGALPLVEVDEPIVMLEGQDNQEDEGQIQMMNPLEAFEGFALPPGIDLHAEDAEDEAMVELAIALSLQEQAGGAALAIQGIQEGLQALEDMHHQHQQGGLHAEPISPPNEDADGGGNEGDARESDATASQNSDEDEGSTVATEGSTMRNSEPGGSVSSSSGSSNAEGNVTTVGASGGGLSSTVMNTSSGDNTMSISNSSRGERDEPQPGSSQQAAAIQQQGVARPFRLALLKAISGQLSGTKDALSIIPLLQVMLVILAELDGNTSEEVECIETVVKQMLEMMNFTEVNRKAEWSRNESSEMALVVLRMLSILVSRWRGSEQKNESSWIARVTAETTQRSGIVVYCKELLHVLKGTWRGGSEDVPAEAGAILGAQAVAGPATPSSLGGSLLKPYPVANPPDYSPFFLKQYIKTHSNDILEELPLLLSEMALRLPYQVKKVLAQQSIFDSEWEELLCEMLQNRNAPFVRRQARKLLLNIAGSRENYHLLRDLHNIKFHLQEFKRLIGYDGNSDSERLAKISKREFKYSQLVAMVEHLNTCIDIATQRAASWQTFCKNEDALQFMIQVGCTADDSLTTAILTLLKIAIDGVPFDSKTESPMSRMSEDEKALKSLAHHVLDSVEKRTFLEFVKRYLLEHSVLSTRWQAHSLLYGFFTTSDCSHQLKLVNAMWELWPFVPSAGSRAAQFVDILGYATLNNDELKSKDLRQQVNFCISSIEAQGNTILSHPNANIYASLVPFVSVDGYYLESEPCEVCYNIDKPYSVQKLNSIKSDAKFTANSQIVKLTSTLSIIRLSIRLTEVKKARMIKSMAIYYSPKNIPIVELKNKPNLWQMARKVNLNPSQTEVKLDFSVPIVAANVMLEFLEFYENVQATAETLQCPRCSASVPAQPGVCSNCGENVYQCHKCRAINYDERDPFICHQCGHCKYAKLEINVLAKNVVAVDPIENEEDAKKAETAVSSLLEKADQTYKQQQYMKAGLESMLQSIKEKKSMAGSSIGAFPTTSVSGVSGSSSGNAGGSAGPSAVSMPASYAAAASALNNNISIGSLAGGSIVTLGSAGIQALAQLPASLSSASSSNGNGTSSGLVLKNVQSLAYTYAIDCKSAYEDLNRIMRKVGAYRKEMLKIDPLGYTLDSVDNVTFRRCYGCMACSITLSLKLLQALITAGSPRDPFDLSFLSFLLRLSQSAGSTALKEQVKNALCFFVKDDALATARLTDMINTRVSGALNRGGWNDVSFETSEEISLLSSLLQMYDSCWEIKLRSLMKIFIQAVERVRNPQLGEAGLLSCLKIIQTFIRATQSGEPEKLTISPVEGVQVDLPAWLRGDDAASFENWRKRLPKVKPKAPTPTKPTKDKKESNIKKPIKIMAKTKPELRKKYLIQKYGRRWIEKFYKVEATSSTINFDSKELAWLKQLLFCPGSVQTRTFTTGLLKDLSQIPERRLKIIELLTKFMEDIPAYGESCREFMELYRTLASPPEFAAFLNAKGALSIVCKLLDEQIEKLHHLETVTLHSDLSQGVAVHELSKLLSTLAIPSVRRNKRVSLLSTVLGGYLALKRIRLHRTRPIEEAQEILLQLLEEITSGTEEETKIFMGVCVETLKKCPKDDLSTPAFVFERVCSLIVHEESDVSEFFVTLDKDPQQEDFLQGRMLGNPYSSNDAGIGPLMRDIKNKICTDCELVALLEDDNGMELLVQNKIISLDLPVKEVYKKLWLPSNGANEPMRIVYRMRGLLGDATEEFVESFASPNEGREDNEVTYKQAKVFVDCGGLKVVLNSLENLLGQPVVMSKTKPLIAVSLKLLGYCAKLSAGREALLAPSLNAIQSLLPILKLCLEHDLTSIQGSSGVVHLTDEILEILEAVLADSLALDKKAYASFAKSRGSIEDVKNLLILSDKLKPRQSTMSMHFKVLAGLTYTDKGKMNLIFDSFKDTFDFIKFDDDPVPDFAIQLEHVCTLVSNVESGPYPSTFKDLAIERKILETCLEYICIRAPTMKPPLGRPDSDDWKDMASKPALKYVLRLLSGFATSHTASQEAVGRDHVYVIHQLEQVSTDEHVGSLAENVLEALRSHDEIWKKVEAARRATREEKKRMAMAMRARQLNTMGMKTNEKGQVTAATSSILEQMEDLAEETGLICVICREGYKYQPTKVLGIYTYSKRCAIEEFETKARKTYGYCTVSHFNVVHIDCHMAAIRLARSRDEWESASLQNANTRCNGLIPLWGPQVPESAFAACLARHNAYLQEATGHRDVGFPSGAHDIKLLLLRFAEEKTFHEDTGGGGPESNMHLVPYLIHTALYVLNTTRLGSKEMSSVEKFLAMAPNTWKDDGTIADGLYYQLVVSLMVHSPEKWMENRVNWLKRVIALGGNRSKQMGNSKFENYKSGLVFLGLIHGLYTIVFKDVTTSGEWSTVLADYTRKNDEALVKSTTTLLNLYQDKLLNAKDLPEILEAIDLKEKVPDPEKFVSDVWTSLS